MMRNGIAKWIIIALITFIILIVAINMFNRGGNQGNIDSQIDELEKNYTETEDGTKVNTSEDVSKDKEVANVLLEESKIIYENGMSKLTSKVTNDAIAKDNLRFKVKFLDNGGTVIAESVGFVGQIKANEIKYIDSYITLDVSNAKSITYELME